MSSIEAKVVRPDDILFRIEAEYTLEDWKLICEALNKNYSYPASELISAIKDCIRQANESFYPEDS